MNPPDPYPIGTPGTRWGAAEKSAWLARQAVHRSYDEEVALPLKATVPARAELLQYGTLAYTQLQLPRYPLYAVRSRAWRADRPTVLVTGGVHGYETSGVQGALKWIATEFDRHAESVNLLVLPCISPWGYETVNRWNPTAVDPNRSFRGHGETAEAALAMECVERECARAAVKIDLHVDLHETTDTDNSEFGPAKAARDGKVFDFHAIPDGFYLVGDSERPAPDFQRALVAAVCSVTHIAEADAHGHLIGTPLAQPGVINYPKRALGLCGGMTAARFVTTTEVYPDSPGATPAECNAAQVATVTAAIAYLLGAPA